MKKYAIVLFLISGLPFLFYSCHEEIGDEFIQLANKSELSQVEQRFLDPGHLKSGDNEQKANFVAEILVDIEKQNNEQRFIENFVKKYGYPDWEMTRFFTNEEQTWLRLLWHMMRVVKPKQLFCV